MRDDPRRQSEHDSRYDGGARNGHGHAEQRRSAESGVESVQGCAIEPRVEQFHRRHEHAGKGDDRRHEGCDRSLTEIGTDQPAAIGYRDVTASPQPANGDENRRRER